MAPSMFVVQDNQSFFLEWGLRFWGGTKLKLASDHFGTLTIRDLLPSLNRKRGIFQ